MTIRAAIYARYSTERQVEEDSLGSQLLVLREDLAAQGWSEAYLLQDSAISGETALYRPGYQQLLDLIRAKPKRIDAVMADSLERLTRDDEEMARLRKLLEFYQVGLRVLAGNINTLAAPDSADAAMFVSSFSSRGQMKTHRQNTRRGLRKRVFDGYSAGGLGYGYRSRADHADRPGDPPGTGPVIGYERIVHEAEAEVIVRVFALFIHGLSPRRIAALLNEEGIPPPGARWANRRTRVARTWTASAIAGSRVRETGILNNPCYRGELVWNRSTWPRDPETERRVRREQDRAEWVTSHVEALRIVSEETWQAVKREQERRGDGKASGGRKRDRRLLSGFLYCAECGARFVLTGANTYACASRVNRGEAVCKARVCLSASQAEGALLEIVQDVLYDEARIADLIERAQARAHRAEVPGDREKLRTELAQADQEARRLVAALAQGVLVEELTAAMRAVEVRRDRLRAVLQQAAAPEALAAIPELVRRAVADLRAVIAGGQTEALRGALSRMVSRIEVRGAEVVGRKLLQPRLLLRGSLSGILTLAKSSRELVAGARFGHLLILLGEPEVEVTLERGRAEVGRAD